MSRIVLNPPPNKSEPFNTGDSLELGDQPKKVIDSLNTMLTELYTEAGTTVVDFGTYPGNPDASVTISGQTGIVAGSLVEAWLVATATADHSIDEHWVDSPHIVAGNIVPGVGFTIYATARDGGRDYGQWTVQWMWR